MEAAASQHLPGALHFELKAQGDLARVSEFMNRRRVLSLAMIRSLHENRGIPLDALIRL